MNSSLRAATFVIVALFWNTESVFAADWRVPRDFATIQSAIDSPLVEAGDRIVVGPGSFAGALVTTSCRTTGSAARYTSARPTAADTAPPAS